MTTLTIDRLGAQGDGVAETESGPVYVPFALPSERVNAVIEGERGTLLSILERSPDRVEPACRHFGDCGGCAVQHLAEPSYRAWKRDKVVQALASRKIAASVSDLLPGQPRSRRRAVFSARRTEKGAVLGYNQNVLACDRRHWRVPGDAAGNRGGTGNIAVARGPCRQYARRISPDRHAHRVGTGCRHCRIRADAGPDPTIRGRFRGPRKIRPAFR